MLSNPTLVVSDLPALARTAHEAGAQLVVDNTFTPLAVTPARWGADVVVHSMTKFISGASDIIAGAVCGSNQFLQQLMDLHTGEVWQDLLSRIGMFCTCCCIVVLYISLATIRLHVVVVLRTATAMLQTLRTNRNQSSVSCLFNFGVSTYLVVCCNVCCTGPIMLQGPTMDPRIASELLLRLPHLPLRVQEHSRRAQGERLRPIAQLLLAMLNLSLAAC